MFISKVYNISTLWLWCVSFWQLHFEKSWIQKSSLRWRHNDHAGVSNHQPHGCLLNRLFRRKSKKTSKLRVTGLCAGNSPGTGEFPAQMASYAENVSIWWRHHDIYMARLRPASTFKYPPTIDFMPHAIKEGEITCPAPWYICTDTPSWPWSSRRDAILSIRRGSVHWSEVPWRKRKSVWLASSTWNK